MELTQLALWLNTTFAELDASVTAAVHQLYLLGGNFMTFLMKAISFWGGYGGAPLIVLTLVLAFCQKTRRTGIAMAIAMAVGALITNLALKPLVLRPRPYTYDDSIYQQIWYIMGCPTETDFSFPSGHTTVACSSALGALLSLYSQKKNAWWSTFLLVLFIILMGVSRIYLAVHYFTDVIGGLVAGAIGGFSGNGLAGLIPSGFYAFRFGSGGNRE
ncbi:MAG: phosphatase PAP2 family protein [Lachnospiraceae bacterium]|nr:phosphatase PAP2 family protein [Lachnospiraceae bacterium]